MSSEFSWWTVSTSIFAIGALMATGAFVQKAKDNATEIVALKVRVTSLENERVEVATLNVKLINLEGRFADLRVDMKQGFEELKFLIRKESSDIQVRQ